MTGLFDSAILEAAADVAIDRPELIPQLLEANGRDIQGFVNALLGVGPASQGYCAYDMNADGVVNLADVSLFVARLLGP